MKEMVYQSRLNRAMLLANDVYKGYEYVVISLGSHPCGYVVLDKEDKLYGMDYDDIHEENDIYVHGGFTYSEDYLSFLEWSDKYDCDVKTSIKDKWVVGWDYGHYGDYYGGALYDDGDGKKWTTAEIVDECKEVIDQIIEINK